MVESGFWHKTLKPHLPGTFLTVSPADGEFSELTVPASPHLCTELMSLAAHPRCLGALGTGEGTSRVTPERGRGRAQQMTGTVCAEPAPRSDSSPRLWGQGGQPEFRGLFESGGER